MGVLDYITSVYQLNIYFLGMWLIHSMKNHDQPASVLPLNSTAHSQIYQRYSFVWGLKVDGVEHKLVQNQFSYSINYLVSA